MAPGFGRGRAGRCAPCGLAMRRPLALRAAPEGKAPVTQAGQPLPSSLGHLPVGGGQWRRPGISGGARGVAGGAGELGLRVTRGERVWLLSLSAWA